MCSSLFEERKGDWEGHVWRDVEEKAVMCFWYEAEVQLLSLGGQKNKLTSTKYL